MGVINNPLWIFVSTIICTLCAIYFSYIFLIGNDSVSDQSLDDKLFSDDNSWIKSVLTPMEQGTTKQYFSDEYGRFFKINSHCISTIEKAQPRFDKLVFVVIDALRVDFVPTIEKPRRYATEAASGNVTRPRMLFMERMLENSGIGLLSLATIPTVTLPRVKALLSGKLPSFMDYILNLSSYSYDEDSFVKQLAIAKKKRIVFYGDDTWSRLFSSSPSATSPLMANNKPPSHSPSSPLSPSPVANQTFIRANFTSSLFASDYTTVDTNVTWNVQKELKQLNAWDVMILHYLGVDHIGHLKGYSSPLFHAKLKEMDKVFEDIFRTVQSKGYDDSYLFVITGDHGMTNNGNHGGSTRDETHTAAIFITSESKTNPQSSVPKRPYPTKRLFSLQARTVMQIDIAPTISALFNIPFPAKNQGRVISSVLDRFGVSKKVHLCHLFQNSQQIQHLIEKALRSNNDNDQYHDIIMLKEDFISALNFHYNYITETMDSGEVFDNLYLHTRRSYQKFLYGIQKSFVKMETVSTRITGLSILIGIILFLILVQLFFEFRSGMMSILFCRRLFTEWIGTTFIEMYRYESFHNVHISMNTPCSYQYMFHYKVAESNFGVFLGLCMVIGPIVCMGSVWFLELEHYYWRWISVGLMIFFTLVFFRSLINFSQSALKHFDRVKRHYRTLLLSSLLSLVLLYILQGWRRPIITEQDLYNWDMFTWLNNPDSKTWLGVIFIFSMASIVAMLPTPSDSYFPRSLVIASFICIYLYRTQTGFVRIYKLASAEEILPRANLLVQAVWWLCAVVCGLLLFNRLKTAFFNSAVFQKISWIGDAFSYLYQEFSRVIGPSHSTPRRKAAAELKPFTSFLYCFIILLVICSCLLIEPAQLPVFAMNMALEKLINCIFKVSTLQNMSQQDRICTQRQMFFKLAVYHVMAFGSFYQMGNSNGLSTVNVNSCFVGLEEFSLLPCTLYMIISMFSTYFYWILAYYVRMQEFYDDFLQYLRYMEDLEDDSCEVFTKQQQKLEPEVEDESYSTLDRLHKSKSSHKIVIEYYCTFYSSINCSLMLRLATMMTNMIVTLVLRDHLFIWSVICPKLLYELIFTVLTVFLHFIIVLLFTHDDCFNLKT